MSYTNYVKFFTKEQTLTIIDAIHDELETLETDTLSLINTSITTNNNNTNLIGTTHLNNVVVGGTVSGLNKSMVGLGNVDNVSDINKVISTLTQTQLDLKAPKVNPTFTIATVGGNALRTDNIVVGSTILGVLNNNFTTGWYSGGEQLFQVMIVEF